MASMRGVSKPYSRAAVCWTDILVSAKAGLIYSILSSPTLVAHSRLWSCKIPDSLLGGVETRVGVDGALTMVKKVRRRICTVRNKSWNVERRECKISKPKNVVLYIVQYMFRCDTHITLVLLWSVMFCAFCFLFVVVKCIYVLDASDCAANTIASHGANKVVLLLPVLLLQLCTVYVAVLTIRMLSSPTWHPLRGSVNKDGGGRTFWQLQGGVRRKHGWGEEDEDAEWETRM